MHGTSKTRLLIGIVAIAAMVLLCLLLPRWGGRRHRAVVEAGETFTVRAPETGRYETTLQDGLPARGQGMTEQRVLQFRRSELIVLTLGDELQNGAIIEEGDVLATFESPRLERQLEEFSAMAASVDAEIDQLQTGERKEVVAEARKRLELAEAEYDRELHSLERIRALAADELVSEGELEAAELTAEILALEIEMARAALRTAQSADHPAAIDALTAQREALDTRIEEVQTLLDDSTIKSPIHGILEIGGRRNMLRVYDIDVIYLRIPIPEADRYRVDTGEAVSFRTPSCRNRTFEGTVVDMGENAINLNGEQIFWASAEVDNPDHALRSGMTGTVRVQLEGRGRGVLSSIWYQLRGV